MWGNRLSNWLVVLLLEGTWHDNFHVHMNNAYMAILQAS
jgi:hypothetical protein